ncbi:proline-rich receptor-like protein kinase PERK2 [Miscanthus floridulus]|uniref:proline-rich receptor-like protein kinase PERK2 n=1 Tax=Miscanthus floridulus TaxID=154761 RepID=UPI00345A0C32
MASPPRGQPQPATAAAPAAAAATSPQLPAASHPLPRAFLATSSPRASAAAPAPPLFTGRPLNPNPPGHGSSVPHGILYPVLRSASTSNSAAAAVTAHLRRVPPMAVGYPRTHAVAVPIAQQQQQPLVRELPRSFAAVPRALVAGVAARPEQPPRGVPIASQPKVNPIPPVAPSNEQSNPKDRENSREEPTVVVINDRKVNLLDSESGSLYALCRSWVRNGVPHESQPSFGNGEPLLPRPLPASVVDSRISERDNNDATGEDSDEEPQKNANGEYNTSDLLKQHVKRAKRIRAGLQKDRSRRIERYKQRLALLL